MTGLLFAGILLATVGCWATLLATSVGHPARRIASMAAAAAPAMLFGSVVVAAFLAAPAGDYRVALEAVSFQVLGDEAFTVGGGTEGDEADDLIVRDLPPHYLTFRPDGGALAVELPPQLDQDGEEPSYAAVRVDGVRPFANSLPLADGDVLGGRQTLAFDLQQRRFGIGTSHEEIPRRRQALGGGLSLPILRNLAAETAIYPLRYWARAIGVEEPATDGHGPLLGSFLSFEGGFLRQPLYLTLVGDDITVTRAGVTTVYKQRIATMRPGEARHFALYRLDYADRLIDEEARSRAQERRSFTAAYANERLTLTLDTPDVFRLSPAMVAELLARQEDNGELLMTTRDPRRNTPVTTSQMALAFGQLGPRIQNELYSAIRVDAEQPDCPLRVTTHTGARCYDLGDAFAVGEDAAAVVRLTRMEIPWGTIAALATLLLVAVTFSSGLEEHAAAAIIVSAAEMLLAVRLLIAFQGALLDPGAASALWESLAAYAILPFVLRVAWLAARAYAGGSVDRGRLIGLVGRGLATVAVVVVALWQARIGPLVIAGIVAGVLIAAPFVGFAGVRLLNRTTRGGGRRPLLAACVLGVIIAVIRVAIWLGLGWKERISLPGFDVAVTVFYLPAVFLFFALLWQRYGATRGSPLTWRAVAGGAVAVLLGALLTVGLPWGVRDSGSAIVHLPAVLLLFALPMLSRRPTRRSAAAGVWLVALMLVHLFLLFVPHLRGVEALADPSQSAAYRAALSDEAAAEQFLESRLQASTNELRLLSHIAPHHVEEAGTSKAEGLVAQRRMLDRYSGRGLLGAGYLEVPLAAFRDTHLNDNLSAIHVLAPFGLVGGLGVLAVLVALAVMPLHDALRPAFAANQTPEEAIDARAAVGILSLWTFCLAGVYMFAANVGLVLFTGKNVYLLAAASKSDLLEGGVLLLAALLGLAPARSEP